MKRTALMFAAWYGDADQVRLLIDTGADVNAGDKDERTALMFAARYGDADRVRLLIDAGADVNARDGDGRTALMRAAQRGRLENVEILVQSGASITAPCRDGKTALDMAMEENHSHVASYLRAPEAMARTFTSSRDPLIRLPTCSVCLDVEACIIMSGCGHLCLCQGCADQGQFQDCKSLAQDQA